MYVIGVKKNGHSVFKISKLEVGQSQSFFITEARMKKTRWKGRKKHWKSEIRRKKRDKEKERDTNKKTDEKRDKEKEINKNTETEE